ncbi:MAG: hypothetical protein ACN6OM_04045 [Alcaligenes nematophilus]|uniref:hypothetical protein n=1 Tax=Alcaligenes nematophilus TaxID=2994643 RepID=UPI003D012B77
MNIKLWSPDGMRQSEVVLRSAAMARLGGASVKQCCGVTPINAGYVRLKGW